jgi:hypothetical protein
MWTIPSWRLSRHRNVRLVEYDAFLAACQTDRSSPIADERIIRPLDTTAEANGANPLKPSGLVDAAFTQFSHAHTVRSLHEGLRRRR